MVIKSAASSQDILTCAFGFDPAESSTHFLVLIPAGSTLPVEISEHLSWNQEQLESSVHYGTNREDGQLRCRLARSKWNDIADVVRSEFNVRLKKLGRRAGKWKVGYNVVGRLLGKELTLLAWAIEDADPALISTAVANWQGLSHEERWWLYTMTAAATGNYAIGRNRGWRKAVRYALTENPLTHHVANEPVVPEYFRLVSESVVAEEADSGSSLAANRETIEDQDVHDQSSTLQTRKRSA